MSESDTTLSGESESGRSVGMVVFDFDGVFTDNTVWTNGAGEEWVRSWRGDGLGLAKLRDLGIPVWVLSTETHPVVAQRCEKLGIPCRQGLDDKRAALQELAGEVGVPLANTVFVGNDINDVDALSAVGLSVVVADAHRDAASRARYRTQARGGFGAVREVCDWITASKGGDG